MERKILKLVDTLKDRWGEGRSLAWNPVSGEEGVPLCFAFGGLKSEVLVWELISPSIWKTRFEGKKYAVRSCAWSPCGQLLAATSSLATAIFKNQEGQDMQLFSFYGAHDIVGSKGTINSVCWSASGSLIATGGGDSPTDDNAVCIWKINPGNIASRPLLPAKDKGRRYKPVKHCNCASGSRLPTNRVLDSAWNVEPDDEFELVAYLQAHCSDVNIVQWHPTVDILFSCSSDHAVKVWADQDQDGPNNWQCVQILGLPHDAHTSTVWGLSFNAGGDKMVSCSDDGTLKVWETENTGVQPDNRFAHWRHLYTLTGCLDGAIFSVHWSREGTIAAGGAHGMIGIFVENNESRVDGPLYKLLLKGKVHDKKVNSVQWSPGENRLLASTSDDGTIKVWKLAQANDQKVQTSNSEANEEV